ncbi:MAG: hypothetical protein EBS20_06160 [Actinobacteria bacterium]|nr:hypothetical protein [Actinomycetota bacterium]
MPGPLAALWLVIVVIAAVVLWSVERGWIGRRSTSASGSDDDAVVTPVTATVAPAVLGYLVAAGDGQRCRCLDDAATATIADLVRRGAVAVASRDGEAVRLATDTGADVTLADHEALVLAHLRAASWPRDGASATVTSGTLAHHRPPRRWWFTWRRGVAAAARADGLSIERVPLSIVAPLWALGVIGAVVAGARVVAAIIGVDPGPLELWTLLGCLGAVIVAVAALDLWGDPDDVITERGRHLVADRLERGIGTDVGPSTGLGQRLGLPEAVACGISGAAVVQAPMLDHRRRRHIWSAATGRPRVVQVVSPVIPGRGGRPLTVAAGGIAVGAAAFALRPLADRLTSWTGVDAVVAIDRYDAVVTAIVVTFIVIGLWLLVAGAIDSFVRRRRTGTVVSVSVMDDRTWWQRLGHRIAAIGHDGTALVELAIDDGHSTRLRSFLVDARAAAPHGATVEVTYTPLLGRVRRLAPVGDAGAVPAATADVV